MDRPLGLGTSFLRLWPTVTHAAVDIGGAGLGLRSTMASLPRLIGHAGSRLGVSVLFLKEATASSWT